MTGTRPPLSARRLLALAAALLVAAPLPLRAQQADLPAAEEIIARHVAAIGGEAAVRKHSGLRATGSFALPAAGIQGKLVLVASAPNRQSMTITLPGLGEIVSGFDGTNAWSLSPMTGARVLEGQELVDTRAESGFHAGQLRNQPGVASRSTTERTELNGESCYRVAVTWESGRESWECYSVESGLLIATGGKRETPQGTFDVVSFLSEYRDIEGVKYAMRAVQQMMGMEQVFQLDKVEFVDVDSAEFTPPPQIQALLQQRTGS